MLNDFDPAAGFTMCVCLLQKEIPVGYATEELADVDEVEVIWGVGPFEGDVVDFEGAVWGDPFGLNGGEVGAGDVGGGVGVCHVL